MFSILSPWVPFSIDESAWESEDTSFVAFGAADSLPGHGIARRLSVAEGGVPRSTA